MRVDKAARIPFAACVLFGVMHYKIFLGKAVYNID
jgi:hypothetical protein